MKKLNLKLEGIGEMLSKDQMKRILGGGYGDYGISGTPGGDNGNPCPQYCQPVGGQIYCIGVRDGVNYVFEGNCNQYPSGQVSGLHNLCQNDSTGDFWC